MRYASVTSETDCRTIPYSALIVQISKSELNGSDFEIRRICSHTARLVVMFGADYIESQECMVVRLSLDDRTIFVQYCHELCTISVRHLQV